MGPQMQQPLCNVCVEHSWGHVAPRVGNLADENSCILSEIPGIAIMTHIIIIKTEYSDFLIVT